MKVISLREPCGNIDARVISYGLRDIMSYRRYICAVNTSEESQSISTSSQRDGAQSQIGQEFFVGVRLVFVSSQCLKGRSAVMGSNRIAELAQSESGDVTRR